MREREPSRLGLWKRFSGTPAPATAADNSAELHTNMSSNGNANKIGKPQPRYVAALDVGTTTLRCHILDERTDTISVASTQVDVEYPQHGYVEIQPEKLWKGVVEVVRTAITNAGLTASQITCLGMSTQRDSFVTWSKSTGEPFHNFIVWQDLRADKLVRQWNKSFTMKALRASSKMLYYLTRNERFLAGSVLELMNPQVTLRLRWVLDHVAGLREALRRGDVMFGTTDTYLLHRLSGGKLHVTDISSAAATGMFDPFTMGWASWARLVFGVPSAILPRIEDSAAPHITIATPDIWGAEIPVSSNVADQSAGLYGSCCFNPGDVKVTLGTGAFLNVNTGSSPRASTNGMYPLVAWRIGKDTTCMLEGLHNDAGTLVNWAIKSGLLSNPQESSDLAESVPDSDGIFFIPSFSGLQAPINDSRAAAGFLGMTYSTRREHMVRAVLESIVYRVIQILRILQSESNAPISCIRLDGGVSRNNFVAQLLADLSGLPVERAASCEMSVLGAGFMAGVAAGVWSGKDELRELRRVDKVFLPREEMRRAYEPAFQQWERAVARFLRWYRDSPVPQRRFS